MLHGRNLFIQDVCYNPIISFIMPYSLFSYLPGRLVEVTYIFQAVLYGKCYVPIRS